MTCYAANTSGKTLNRQRAKAYLFDKYNRIHFEEKATCAAVRKTMIIFVLNVLDDAICQSDPNCGTLGYWLVDEHLCIYVRSWDVAGTWWKDSLAGRKKWTWMTYQNVAGSSSSWVKALSCPCRRSERARLARMVGPWDSGSIKTSGQKARQRKKCTRRTQKLCCGRFECVITTGPRREMEERATYPFHFVAATRKPIKNPRHGPVKQEKVLDR
jgi:hypothetical protein